MASNEWTIVDVSERLMHLLNAILYYARGLDEEIVDRSGANKENLKWKRNFAKWVSDGWEDELKHKLTC